MERSRTPLLSAVRLLAVVSAVGLAAGYVIFAQVNGSKQSAAAFPIPPLESQGAVTPQEGRLNAPLDLSSVSVQHSTSRNGTRTYYIDKQAIGAVLQSSSKSGVLTHEATAIVAGGLMDVVSVPTNWEAPPTPTPSPYVIFSSKNMPLKREAEAIISVTGLKALPPAPTIPPVPNVPPSGIAPLILPVATPLPAAR